MLQQTGIFCQRGAIARAKLAQRRIDKPAAHRRPCPQNLQILRAEQHRGKAAAQLFGAFLLHVVAEQLPPLLPRKEQRPQVQLAPGRLHPGGQLGKVLPKADQLGLAPGAKAGKR